MKTLFAHCSLVRAYSRTSNKKKKIHFRFHCRQCGGRRVRRLISLSLFFGWKINICWSIEWNVLRQLRWLRKLCWLLWLCHSIGFRWELTNVEDCPIRLDCSLNECFAIDPFTGPTLGRWFTWVSQLAVISGSDKGEVWSMKQSPWWPSSMSSFERD